MLEDAAGGTGSSYTGRLGRCGGAAGNKVQCRVRDGLVVPGISMRRAGNGGTGSGGPRLVEPPWVGLYAREAGGVR